MLLLFFINKIFELHNPYCHTVQWTMGHITWILRLPNEFDPQVDRTGGRPVTVIPVIVVNGVWLVKSSGVLSSIDERKNVWSTSWWDLSLCTRKDP